MSYRSETILSGELSEDRDRKRNNQSNLILMSSHPHLQLINKQSIFYIFPQILFIHKFLFIRDQYNIFPSFSSLI